jgi:hypothetical protein
MRKIVSLLTCLAICLQLNAQYLEVGTTVGLTSSISDLQPSNPSFASFGLTYGLVGRYHYRPSISLKATAMAGSFYATDRRARGSIRFRNLESRTQFYELAATAEWNIMPYDIMEGKTTTPYLFAGVAGLYFNPQARPNLAENTWVNLRELGTEGQTLDGGKLYSPLQVAIPFGFGMKTAFGKRINVGLEAGMRFTFTDYLDDISGNYPDLEALKAQNPTAAALSFRMPEAINTNIELPSGSKRGDNYKNDLYYYIGLNFTYNLADTKKMEFNPQYKAF